MPLPEPRPRRSTRPRKAQLPAPAPAGNGGTKQQRLRQALIDEALRQFELRGFEAVTVTDIVEHVEVSRRSFFRYFDSKDDLVFSWLDEMGDMIRPVLCERLASGNVPRALRDAFIDLARRLDRNPDRAVFLTRLIFETPSLGGRYHHEAMRWEAEFVRIAQAMLPALKEQRFELRVQSALAIAAWISALLSWAEDKHTSPLAGLVEAAFQVLMQGAGDRPRKPKAELLIHRARKKPPKRAAPRQPRG